MRRRDFITLLGCAAAAWPLHAHAQQPAMPVIGFMSARSPEESAHLVEAFRRGLREGGFAENEKVAIEFRWAKGDYGRLPALAAELVNRRVNVLTAVGGGDPDRVRDGGRSDRQRPRRDPGATGRQRYRRVEFKGPMPPASDSSSCARLSPVCADLLFWPISPVPIRRWSWGCGTSAPARIASLLLGSHFCQWS